MSRQVPTETSNRAHYVSSVSQPLVRQIVVGRPSDRRVLTLLEGSATSSRGLLPSASRPSAEEVVARVGERFAELVAEIPQVKAVLLDLSGDVPQIITYMSPRDIEARTHVYDAERAVSAGRVLPPLEFRVISLDAISPERIDQAGPGVRRLLRRD